MDLYQPDQWHDFFLATAGAAAALTGLLFVAISLHIRYIATDVQYRSMARGSLIGLVMALVLSLAALLHQPSGWLGWELVGIGIAYAPFGGVYQLFKARRRVGRVPGNWVLRAGAGYLLALAGLLGGLSVALRAGPGLFVVAFIIVVIVLWNLWDAWVLLMGVADEELAAEGKGP
jgi:modulator of FtsH protease